MQTLSIRSHAAGAALTLGLLLTACSGGGGSVTGSIGGLPTDGFEVQLSVPDSAIWQINRPIVMDFSLPVDFSTIGFNTVRITDPTGAPATGEFTLVTEQQVKFQPTCPVEEDYSDAGFAPGGVNYTIELLGEGSLSLAVQSTTGTPLKTAISRSFVTPNSTLPQVLFVDEVPGPPAPVIQGQGGVPVDAPVATRVEVGGDSSNPRYFTDYNDGQGIVMPTDMPLNLTSEPSTSIDYVLEIDQPVNPSSLNVSSDNLYFEYGVPVAPGSTIYNWNRATTLVELVRNCSESGATIRLRLQGVLPTQARLRAVISPAFEDLVGERNLLALNDFGVIETAVVDLSPLPDPQVLADGIFENFVLSAGQFGSREDSDFVSPLPPAEWNDGRLKAAFDFTGDGGPGGDFDVLIKSGIEVFLNTTADTIFGGPQALDGVNSTSQAVIGGLLNVRNLRIEDGGRLLAVGPNPLRIQATGTVEVFGGLVVDGANGKNVGTLGTGHIVEAGANGNAGGGKGGDASYITNSSTPKGGDANGAYNIAGIGGKGGESGYATGDKNKRRPGGGGGGVMNKDQGGTMTGMNAVPGSDGNPAATGAVTGLQPPQGGAVGDSPFLDADPENDFYGLFFDADTQTLKPGELSDIHAGAGGGAGGDALPSNQFPSPDWKPASDEKGAGGGGGAGGLMVLALENIVVSGEGLINSMGGRGGSGENTIYTDHIGGGSGGGSGGHIVLQAKQLDLTGAKTAAIESLGGRGGWGQGQDGSTNAGGAGGPGLIQIHVQDPDTDILFGVGGTLNKMTQPRALTLVPLFGPISESRSTWMPLGAAEQSSFVFQGLDLMTGLVESTDGVVDDVPDPLLGPQTLVTTPALPSIASDGRTLEVDASVLAGTFDDLYLRNSALLRGFAVELTEVGNPTSSERYDIVDATYDLNTGRLSMTTDAAGPKLSEFSAGAVEYLVIRRSFRVFTSDIPDALPENAAINVVFQGARADANGQPDEADIAVDWTADITDFDLQGLDFIRFLVTFDIDVLNEGLSAENPRPELRHLSFPFRFGQPDTP